MNNPAAPDFQPFGFQHWAMILGTLLVIFILLAGAKRVRAFGNDRFLRKSLAAVLVVNMIAAFFFYLHLGILKLPLQLCDLAVFLMAFALVFPENRATELAFYWGLAGSLQAVLTPDLAAGFPSFQFCQFFFSHCAVILSAAYLAIRGEVRLNGASVWRALFFTNLYAGVAGLINWRFGMNYGYLAAKPAQPSVLDHFGPWPYYIIAEEFFALGLFFLCFVFGRFLDRLARGPSNGMPSGLSGKIRKLSS